jgi:hypothetical protein
MGEADAEVITKPLGLTTKEISLRLKYPSMLDVDSK